MRYKWKTVGDAWGVCHRLVQALPHPPASSFLGCGRDARQCSSPFADKRMKSQGWQSRKTERGGASHDFLQLHMDCLIPDSTLAVENKLLFVWLFCLLHLNAILSDSISNYVLISKTFPLTAAASGEGMSATNQVLNEVDNNADFKSAQVTSPPTIEN